MRLTRQEIRLAELERIYNRAQAAADAAREEYYQHPTRQTEAALDMAERAADAAYAELDSILL